MTAPPVAYLDPRMQTSCSVAAAPGQYLLESSILTTASLYTWVGKTFYESDSDPAEVLRRLSEDAASAKVGAGGLIVLPHFQGRGAPDWNPDATGVFANFRLSTTRGDIVRSVLEGIAAEIAENVALLHLHLPEGRKVFSSGGLSQLPLFNQIQADMYNQEVFVPENDMRQK